jgi:hypothetical protein
MHAMAYIASTSKPGHSHSRNMEQGLRDCCHSLQQALHCHLAFPSGPPLEVASASRAPVHQQHAPPCIAYVECHTCIAHIHRSRLKPCSVTCTRALATKKHPGCVTVKLSVLALRARQPALHMRIHVSTPVATRRRGHHKLGSTHAGISRVLMAACVPENRHA